MLLVDDEPLVLEGLTFMVDWERYGFRVCGEACDGEDALEQIGRLRPDLVVTDLRMPAMNGLELMEQCYRLPETSCRFVILSGHAEFSDARQALTYGVTDYWLKPIDTDEIHRTLEKLSRDWLEERTQQAVAAFVSVCPPPADEEDALHSAEDELLSAIEMNDSEQLDRSSKRLWELTMSSFDTPLLQRTYLSNLLLELFWKTAEDDADSNADSDLARSLPANAQVNRHLSVAFLQADPGEWGEPLRRYCQAVADFLAAQRERAGPAGEVVRHIHREYSKPLKLHDVAEILHFQPAYLGQLFKKHTGMSFLEYLHRTRVEAACKLLRRTDSKIADVAKSVGYADPDQFAEKFKKYKKKSPSQYKK